MKKIIISAILLAAASIGAVYFKSTHIYMNKSFYSKDEKEMWVFAEDKDFSTKKLNQFTELETLNVENVNDDIFEDFGDFKELSHIFSLILSCIRLQQSSIHTTSLNMLNSMILRST